MPSKIKTVNRNYSNKKSFPSAPFKDESPLTYTFYRSVEFGSNILVTNVKESNKNFSLSFLVDSLKLGLKDFSIKNIAARKYMKEMNNFYDFIEISIEDATKFLAQGVAIAKIVGTPISENCLKWLKEFKIEKINLSGSLYKCSECETGELSKDIVKEILKIARDELKSGVAGTPDELITDFHCKECELNMLNLIKGNSVKSFRI